MPKFIVDLWLDGYETEEQMTEACKVFIYEQLSFSASSVKIECFEEKDEYRANNINDLRGNYMEKVTVYKSATGNLEIDPARAFAWDLVKMSETTPQNELHPVIAKVEFGAALWILKNKEIVKELIADYEYEIEQSLKGIE
jgi:hypothetical protein